MGARMVAQPSVTPVDSSAGDDCRRPTALGQTAGRMTETGPTSTASSGRARHGLLLAAGLTVLAGFGVGFALARTTAPTDRAATPTTVAVPVATTPTLAEPTTTTATAAAPSTTSAPTSAPTTSTTTSTVTPTTAPPTVAPTTRPSETTVPFRPAELVVAYTRDAQGRLVLPLGGSAVVTITNQGGGRGQWLLAGFGYVSANGVTRGELEPGASATALVAPSPGSPPGTTGTLTVLGAGPTGSTSVPTVVG